MNAQTDAALVRWLYGIVHGEPTPPGEFLQCLAQAALRADVVNYARLRPALLEIAAAFPEYRCACPGWEASTGAADIDYGDGERCYRTGG